ncbi:hypothetical protein CHLRE_09g388050v5 [Chlamydomonas reinhardtii]|uniref:Uncharacterized protein n=1 Tax=Chlamydomonas reinhardtii TaxID=3055 RepID=A0A2K3DDP5_CHLRE|nr:uncharacterized protein CHLRE_09g388050v5 [Chlamydomonas reinhardtii]PNW78658.1 hypothetical protein CHLRE_09g388050v5 [Chlamydomonas reinhardtii]
MLNARGATARASPGAGHAAAPAMTTSTARMMPRLLPACTPSPASASVACSGCCCSAARGLPARGAHAAMPKRRPLAPLCAAAAGSQAVNEEPRVEEPSTAMLLAWFACGNRSLFAAQCLVEVLVELYREGRSFQELQLSIKAATQGGGWAVRPAADPSGSDTAADDGTNGEAVVLPPLLQTQEEDVLVSWVALVFLTLEDLGVPRDKEPADARRDVAPGAAAAGLGATSGPGAAAPGGGMGLGVGAGGLGSMASSSTYLRGMLGYVRQTLGMYDEGQTLARVAGLQGLVQQSSGAATSPFLFLMQQYTRLVLLTVEVVAASGLHTERPLRAPDTITRPSGYSTAFVSSCTAADLDSPPAQPPKAAGVPWTKGAAAVGEAGAGAGAGDCPPRGLAVRLLMAFTGAVLGSRWSLERFVDAVRVAYDQGLAADELFSQLEEAEFAQSGGLLPMASQPAANSASAEGAGECQPLPAPAPAHEITQKLLSSWISLSYMTLAQLHVPYPAAAERVGWAWAGLGDATEAFGLNDFVGNVLRQIAGEEPRMVPPPSIETAPAPAAQVIAAAPAQEPAAAGEEAPTPPQGTASTDRRRAGAFMMRVEDDNLRTSTAFRVVSQQVALVQAVCRDVMG